MAVNQESVRSVFVRRQKTAKGSLTPESISDMLKLRVANVAAKGGELEMPAEDKEMTRMVQREIARRYVDTRGVDVKAIHGVVYLRGVVRPLRGVNVDIQQEIEIIERILRNKPGIRDVVNEMTIR